MTHEEKKAILDAVDAAEKEALNRVTAKHLADAEVVVLKLAAQVRAAVRAVDTTDLPVVEG
ncbi:hypothetical protein Rctr197k_190 [Virus Rctr197k]|nr:hypothetical protein Rctr197k_190 [Virus Rctr197k]